MFYLRDYLFKYVKVIDTDGETHRGFVDTYTSAADNDDTEPSISLLPNENSKSGIELYRSEIKSIEEMK